jgi:hypothetical protein
MDKSRKDIFETTTENRIAGTNDNFFLFDDSSNITIPKASLRESTRRLNDYDFNLLKEDAYKDVSDDLFKLEYNEPV